MIGFEALLLVVRVVVRIGWSGAMRDYADPSSNATAYTRVAVQIADVVAQLPLPPPDLLPLLVHAGNELNACNEWQCTGPSNTSMSSQQMATEVASFARDVAAALAPLRRGQHPSWSAGRLQLAPKLDQPLVPDG